MRECWLEAVHQPHRVQIGVRLATSQHIPQLGKARPLASYRNMLVDHVASTGKPYQKGAVEHMIKLIRQYVPKGNSLRKLTQTKLDGIAHELNSRIRYRLCWESPAGILSRLTAATTS